LSGDLEEWDAKSVAEAALTFCVRRRERIAHLEKEVAHFATTSPISKGGRRMKQQFAAFKKQFD